MEKLKKYRKKRPSLCFSLIFFITFWTLAPARAENPSEEKTQSRAEFEFGIDAWERKFFRPQLSFSWPLKFMAQTRLFSELSYLERANSRLEGAVDFWLILGLEKKWGEKVKLEGRLNHFCRHITSQENTSILNLNEAIARLWINSEGSQMGLGFGGYIGGTKGYKNLLVFNLNFFPFFSQDISIGGEFKWVNFKNLLYDLELSFVLNRGIHLFIRNSKTYQFEPTFDIGIRMKSEGNLEKHIDHLKLSAGLYPFCDLHKLIVQGENGLEFLKTQKTRFLCNIHYGLPILSGDSYFAQFWPDKIAYRLQGEYEKKINEDFFFVGYARYAVDMPVDKDLEYRSSLSTGIRIRNQRDFEQLEKGIRFDLSVGYSFKLLYDLSAKIGLNTLNDRSKNIGSDILFEADDEKKLFSMTVFMNFGHEINIRPFFGFRTTIVSNKRKTWPGPSEARLIAGISLYSWF
ncbi:MAG: hypothetical protein WCC06_04210 [Candidatus Aminicenantales bacterium]